MPLENFLIDITPEVCSKLGVFPGDRPFSLHTSMDFSKGDHLKLSSIETTLHLGAHADAPNHYHKDGVGISERSLNPYLGKCQVVDIDIKRGERISSQHFDMNSLTEKRILFKTGSFPDSQKWNSDFAALDPELIRELGERGVILIGIDTPSIDLENSKSLESHNEVFRQDMAILEGLVLSSVEAGVYNLLALPLKLKDADAAPVRAVLLKEGFSWKDS